MRRTMLIGLLVVAVLALAGSAQAQFPPTTHPLESRMLQSVERVAVGYWQRRGVALPQPVEVFSFSEGRGEEPGHRVWLPFASLHFNGAAWRRIEARATLCVIYLHERGHNAGLSHGSGWPVMNYNADAGSAPHICWWWARRIARGQFAVPSSPPRRSDSQPG